MDGLINRKQPELTGINRKHLFSRQNGAGSCLFLLVFPSKSNRNLPFSAFSVTSVNRNNPPPFREGIVPVDFSGEVSHD